MKEALQELKARVLRANLLLKESRLVTLTWGNVSEIDRARGLVAIKPSGVAYDSMTVEDIVVTDTEGNVVEGNLRPSSDLATHLALYRAFSDIRAVAHTHSKWATVFAQAGHDIPMLGTTHADTFYGDIPCTRGLTREEIFGAYEAETGKVIVETFAGRDPLAVPAVLVRSHAPFTWGADAVDAVQHAVILEEVACMALHTLLLAGAPTFDRALADKHYGRKHGADAYYGQEAGK